MFKFPYTNLHELNLDWILEKVKTLVENNDEFNDKADYAVETADEAKEIAEQAAQATIADGAVTTQKIADYAVTQQKLAINSVGTYQIIDANVTNAKIADNAINSAKIADNSISIGKIDFQTLVVEIPYSVTAGGNAHDNVMTYLNQSIPTGYSPFSISGWASGNANILIPTCRLVDDNYSIYLKNTFTSDLTGTAKIYVIIMKS